MAQLTKIEEALLKEIDKAPYDLNEKQLPYKRGELKITHRADCTDPIALFRPAVVICYGGKFRGKEFVAIGDTNEGFEYIQMAAVGRVRSIVVRKVTKWIRKHEWLRRLLPFNMILEVLKEETHRAEKRDQKPKVR